MSRPRSESPTDDASVPELDHRPDDHADALPAPDERELQNPRLGFVGWVRFLWRQLTSMRTALALLLLLGLAAVPGSLVPQRSADPNGVVLFERENPQAFKILDALQAFDTYNSFWFSSIYILLFVSLIGCIIPRTAHHLRAVRAAPPLTPVRLSRLPAHRVETSAADAERALAVGRQVLRRSGYRVVRHDQPGVGGGRITLSAERGYLRETGNLVFHTALVGLIVSGAIGGGFVSSGQKIVIQGQTFTNARINYDTFKPGRFFADSQLDPYSLRLDRFVPTYTISQAGKFNPTDFSAYVSTREPNGSWKKARIQVNSPLSIGGTQVYLLGNGYAPIVSVLDSSGKVVDRSTTPFLAQDAALTSLGVIKVPDGLARQVALRGFFYPQPVQTSQGAASIYPDAGKETLLSLEVWTGDLGLDRGTPVNVYSLDTSSLVKVAGRGAPAKALELRRGDAVPLPNGLGSVRFDGWKRFVGLQIQGDRSQPFIAGFVILAVAGLLLSLFVPRRRAWIAASTDPDGRTRIEYAGLARGDDPRLQDAIDSLAWQHLDRLGERPEWTVSGRGSADGWRT